MNMNGKMALVTGASSGIGKATAERLSPAGRVDAGIRKNLRLAAI